MAGAHLQSKFLAHLASSFPPSVVKDDILLAIDVRGYDLMEFEAFCIAPVFLFRFIDSGFVCCVRRVTGLVCEIVHDNE